MVAMRTETDMLGSREIPAGVLYGIHTLRAMENFCVSGQTLQDFPQVIRALALVKKAAALANRDLGQLPQPLFDAIDAALDRILDGDPGDQWFPVDMMQGGAGTSTNMNINEVVANLALAAMGRPAGDYAMLHPNDHVNLSQSTNDVYPTAIRLAVLLCGQDLIEAMGDLCDSLRARSRAFAGIIKVGRTQLQDAVPMTLGLEFGAFAETVEEDVLQLRHALRLMREINLGGTAIGTGVNAPPGFAEAACRHLSEQTGIGFTTASNLVEATSDTGAFVSVSGALKRIAVKLTKICNDLRLLASGPRAGLGEIRLPAMQAGSSIMPGKVNPVIPEMMNQIGFQVIGNDLTVTLAAGAGQLQLNAMEPVIVLNLLQTFTLLTRGIHLLRTRCIDGIEADEARCRALYHGSLVMAAALNPHIGYSQACHVARQALESGSTLREVVVTTGTMDAAALERVFSAEEDHVRGNGMK